MSLSIRELAATCHQANLAIQLATGDPAPSPAWDNAPDWQRDSAIDGVRAALAGATPEQLHEEWVESKLMQGWRYGDQKDATAMTHPCLVPYADLPLEQRVKDITFRAIVTALAPQLPAGATAQRTPVDQARYEKSKARFFTASEHPPVVALRDQIIGLGMLIDEHVPPGRNQSLALTALEDVQMRGNRGFFAPEGLR